MNSRRVVNLCVRHASALFRESYLLEVPEWVPATIAHHFSPSRVFPRAIITCAERFFSLQTIPWLLLQSYLNFQ